MATKGPLAVSLLSLLCRMMVTAQELSDYDTFLKQHIDFPKNEEAYCNKIMKEREGVLGSTLENTFIHASEYHLQHICFLDGQPQTGLHRSLHPIPHTKCIATSEEGQAFSGIFEYDLILVWCENGFPTMFHGHPLN